MAGSVKIPPRFDLPSAAAAALPAPTVPLRLGGDRLIAATLRAGALLSGGLFLLSLLLPDTAAGVLLAVHLRKAAASVLLGTPVLRLAVAGVALGVKGEWRYTAYAAVVLLLLALAVTAHLSA